MREIIAANCNADRRGWQGMTLAEAQYWYDSIGAFEDKQDERKGGSWYPVEWGVLLGSFVMGIGFFIGWKTFCILQYIAYHGW